MCGKEEDEVMLRTFISFDNPPPPVYLLDAAQSDISAGGRRGEGVPSPMFTVTYPLILEHSYTSVELVHRSVFTCGEGGLGVPCSTAPVTGSWISHVQSLSMELQASTIAFLFPITPMQRIRSPLKYWTWLPNLRKEWSK